MTRAAASEGALLGTTRRDSFSRLAISDGAVPDPDSFDRYQARQPDLLASKCLLYVNPSGRGVARWPEAVIEAHIQRLASQRCA